MVKTIPISEAAMKMIKDALAGGPNELGHFTTGFLIVNAMVEYGHATLYGFCPRTPPPRGTQPPNGFNGFIIHWSDSDKWSEVIPMRNEALTAFSDLTGSPRPYTIHGNGEREYF